MSRVFVSREADRSLAAFIEDRAEYMQLLKWMHNDKSIPAIETMIIGGEIFISMSKPSAIGKDVQLVMVGSQ